MPISWLNHKPRAIAVYASWPALPSAHATLATGRPATALPGPVFHRLDCTSFCWRLRKSRLAPPPEELSRGSHFGVHRFQRSDERPPGSRSANDPNSLPPMETAQIASAVIVQFLQEMGV